MGGIRAFLTAGAIAASVAACPAWAAAALPVESGARTGSITVAIPPGTDRNIKFTFGDGKVSLELPNGATFPMDFVRESNGLLRVGEVVPIDAEHLRLDLRLAAGVVDRIEVGPNTVVVAMRRRFADATDGLTGRDDDYRLGPDDKIQVAVNGDPKLTQQVVVSPDGRVSLPLVGDVTVGGSTVREAAENVTELLARDYLVDPNVDIQIMEYKSRWVMVTGEVGKPGRVALRGGATLKDALADADGLSVGAGDEIVISRDAPDGKRKIQIPIDRNAFEHAESNPALKTGDIVNVPARPYVYIQGEVHLPNKVPLERGMTLMKAIAIVGGLTEWANEKGVQIMSERSTGAKRLYNLKDIRAMRVPDPPLKGGDVVYIKRRFL